MAKGKKTSFITNIGKSVGLSTLDAFTSLVPNLKSNLNSNVQFVKTSYSPIKEKLTSKSDINKNNPVTRSTKEFITNALDDLKTGKFYNTERLKKAENKALEAFGFDGLDNMLDGLDNMLDGMDDVDESSGNTTNLNNQNNIVVNNIQTGGNEALNMGISNLGLISNSVLKTNATSFSTISYQISKINQFHNENTVNFYRDVSDKLSTIAENTQKLGTFVNELAEAGTRSASERKNLFQDFMSVDGLDFSSMFDVYKTKSGLSSDSFDAVKTLFDMAVKPEIDKAISNPIGFIMSKGIQATLPKAFKNSMKDLNDTFNTIPVLMQQKFKTMKNSSNPFVSFLGDFLAIEPNRSKLSSFGKSGTKRAVFDEMTRRSITHVMPGLLSKILASVSDNPYYKKELVYDYDKGKFTNKSRMRNQLVNDVHAFREDTEVKNFKDNIIDKMSFKNDDDKKAFIKDINDSLLKMIKNGDIISSSMDPNYISKNKLVSQSILNEFKKMSGKDKALLMKAFANSITDYNNPFDNIMDNQWMQAGFDIDFSQINNQNNLHKKIEEDFKESAERLMKSKDFKKTLHSMGINFDPLDSYNNLMKKMEYDTPTDSIFGKASRKIDSLINKTVDFFDGEPEDTNLNSNFIKTINLAKDNTNKKKKTNANFYNSNRNNNSNRFSNKNFNKLESILSPMASNVSNIRSTLDKIFDSGIKTEITSIANKDINYISNVNTNNYSDILMTISAKLDNLENLKNMPKIEIKLGNIFDSVEKISVLKATDVVQGDEGSTNRRGFFNNIFNKIRSKKYNEAFKTVNEKIKGIKDNVMSKGETLFGKASSIFSGLFNMKNFNSLLDTGKNIYDTLYPIIGSTLTSMLGFGKTVGKNALGLGKTLAKNGIKLGGKALNWIGNKGIPMFGDTATSIWNWGDKTLKSAWSEGKNLFNIGKDKLTNSESKISSKLTDLFSKGKGVVSKMQQRQAIKNSQMVYITGGNLDSIKEVVYVREAPSEMNSAFEQRELYKKNRAKVIDLASKRREKNKNNNSSSDEDNNESNSNGIFSTIKNLFGDKIMSKLGQTKLGGKILSKFSGLSKFTSGLNISSGVSKGLSAGGSLLGKAGSAVGSLGSLGSKASGLAKLGGGLLSKVALPLAIAKGAFDGFNGWNNAGEVFATGTEDPTLGQKASSALGSTINGLTFGIPDKIFGQGSTSRFIHGTGSLIGKGAKTALKYSPIGLAAGLLGGKIGKSSATPLNDNDQKKENSLGENANDPNVRTATIMDKMQKFFLKGPFAMLFGPSLGFLGIFKKMFSGIKKFFSGIFSGITKLLGGNKESDGSDQTLGGSTEFGAYSMTFESEVGGNNPGIVSNDPGDYGGLSAGLFQFSKNMGSLKNIIDAWAGGSYGSKAKGWGERLQKVYNNDSQLTATWKQIAKEDSKDFGQAQIDYWNQSTYYPWAKKLKAATGYDVTTKSQGLQATAISTVTQHGSGGALSIFKKSINNLMSSKSISDSNNISDSDLINAVYDERGRKRSDGNLAYFYSSSASIQKGVSNRFVRERKQALSMAGTSTNSSNTNTGALENSSDTSSDSSQSTATKEDNTYKTDVSKLSVASNNFWNNNANSYWGSGSSSTATNISNSSRSISNTNARTSRNFSSGVEVLNDDSSIAVANTDLSKTTEDLKMDIMKELQTQLNDVSSNTANSNQILSNMLQVLQDMKNNSNTSISTPSNLNAVLQGY